MTTPYASEAYLHQILGKALAAQASDVHIKVGQPPGARVRGDLVYFRVDKIRPEDTDALVRLLLGPKERIEAIRERVTSYDAGGLGRFRVTIYRQRGSLALVMHRIPARVPLFADLGLPAAVTGMVEQGRGLFVVAGGPGQGKSTSLAAMVGHVNAASPRHVITVEDPIEFVHEDGRASVSQREVGADTPSLCEGLRAAALLDPDLVLVSTLDSAATLDAALCLVEAGRLVLTALPAFDVAKAVGQLFRLARGEGIADAGRPVEIERVIEALTGVLAQRLLVKRDGSGLVVATELLVATPEVRAALRVPERDATLRELMEKGASPHGMTTFEAEIQRLSAQNLIARPGDDP